jgi:hypothetical protein
VPEELEAAVGSDRRTFIKRLVLGTAFAAPIVSSFTMSGIEAIFGTDDAGATTAMSNANTSTWYPSQLGVFALGAGAGGTKSFAGPPSTTVVVQPNTFSSAMTLFIMRGHPPFLQPHVPAGYTVQSAVSVEWPGSDALLPITLTVNDPAVELGDELFEFVVPAGTQTHPGVVSAGQWVVTFTKDPAFLVATPPALPPTSPPAGGSPGAGSTDVSGAATAPDAVVAGPETTG